MKAEKEMMISNVLPHNERSLVEPTQDTESPQLSEELEKDLIQVFKLLSDETRLRILLYLRQERELHVTALCDKLGQSQPAVSHHLALLRVAGLIEARRDGKHNYYHVQTSQFYHLMSEAFAGLTGDNTGQIRFEDFVLTHKV